VPGLLAHPTCRRRTALSSPWRASSRPAFQPGRSGLTDSVEPTRILNFVGDHKPKRKGSSLNSGELSSGIVSLTGRPWRQGPQPPELPPVRPNSTGCPDARARPCGKGSEESSGRRARFGQAGGENLAAGVPGGSSRGVMNSPELSEEPKESRKIRLVRPAGCRTILRLVLHTEGERKTGRSSHGPARMLGANSRTAKSVAQRLKAGRLMAN